MTPFQTVLKSPGKALLRAIVYSKGVKEWDLAIELSTTWTIKRGRNSLLMQRPGGEIRRVNGTCNCPGFHYRQECTHKRALELLVKYVEVGE